MRKHLDWQPVSSFNDPKIPKLDNLRIAAKHRLTIPPTWWARAREICDFDVMPPASSPFPVIVRSASPTEDTHLTSNAGQLHSEVAPCAALLGTVLKRVYQALPTGDDGLPLGAIFLQPFLNGDEAGIAFFDGFYYERTKAIGSNTDLTAGADRGDVSRGGLERGEPWSDWLQSVYRVFGLRNERLDIEYARIGNRYVLLQVRPALFPIVRNEILSLANHKEIMGDPPSPWIVSVLEEAGVSVPEFFAKADARVAAWDERYAIVLAERAWMNFSFFFQLMDHWGLPRSFVTEGVGGDVTRPEDKHILPLAFVAAVPDLVRLQLLSLWTVMTIETEFRTLDRKLSAANSLQDLYAVNVAALTLAIRTNFAINGILSGVSRVRRVLRLPGKARVITEEMMQTYHALASLPDPTVREQKFEEWLGKFGHRGPLESDPARPRFSEIAELLKADIAHDTAGEPDEIANSEPQSRYPWFLIDERREWFRDELMRRWQTMRRDLLAEGGKLTASGLLDAPEDVFRLKGCDLNEPNDYRRLVQENKTRFEVARALQMPLTATRDEITEIANGGLSAEADGSARTIFPGIALSQTIVEGVAVKADDLVALLRQIDGDKNLLGRNAILVVPSLEPSWAVVFPRFRGVVAEVGGELSHASILLREARKPALVNCRGIFSVVQAGDRLRLDGARGIVERINAAGSDSLAPPAESPTEDLAEAPSIPRPSP